MQGSYLEKNIGSTDRVIRIIIGLALIGLILSGTLSAWWATAAIILALTLLLTAKFEYCFTYQLLGISTRKVRE